MSITGIIGAIGPVAKVLLKALELVDPKTRDWVHKRKALEWGEKYIRRNHDLLPLLLKQDLTAKEKRKVKYELKMLKNYEKWFFEND